MIGILRSILFYSVFVVGSVPIILLMALLSPISREIVRRGSQIWAGWFVWCAAAFLGIRLQVRGRIPQEGVIVASKHQSGYEAILTLYLFHHPGVVMKAELKNIPVWGYLADRHGSIFVERGQGGSAFKSMLRQARARAAEGRPVFIFPEGTRVPVGEAPPLKAGLFGVYSGLRVPVVAVAHNAGEFWTKGFAKRPGTVTVSFLPEIPPLLPREELESRVHTAINENPLTAEVLV